MGRGYLYQLPGLLLCLHLLWPVAARACSCGHGDLGDAFRGSDLVFYGRVLRAGNVVDTGPFVSRTSRFEVLAVYKGSVGERVSVGTYWAGGSCGFPFEAGREYLVFARDEDRWLPGPNYMTDICTRTTPLPEAAVDLRALGAPLPRKKRMTGWQVAAMGVVLVLFSVGIGWQLWRLGRTSS